MKYTKEDVIIWADDERVEIGQEYYIGERALEVLENANKEKSSCLGKLQKVSTSSSIYPFLFFGDWYFPFIIRKKSSKVNDKEN